MSAFDLVEPATGERLASVPQATTDDVDRLVRKADGAFGQGPWRSRNSRERGRTLSRLAALLRENLDGLARLEARNVGKPIRDARDEVQMAADCFEFYAGTTDKIGGQTIPGAAPGVLMTFREPIGVCGIIVPWNFPLAITSWKLAPALAMGNCVVLKPAEQTPLTALRLAELALEAGVPEGVLSVVTGQGSVVGSALVTHPLVRKVSFTGSTAVGREVMRAAADGVKRVTLELGGKSANVIFDDCDFARAVASAVTSSLGNAGQDCCARSRILVQATMYDRFVDALVAAFERIRVGDPLADVTEMGPLVSAAHLDRVTRYIESGLEEGATLATGGGRPAAAGTSGCYLAPTIFTGVRSDMKIAREEIFGPVVTVMPFADEAEAVRMANDTDYGLSGSVWTSNLGRAMRVVRAVHTGNLSVNSGSSVHLEAPFGGVRQSGLGRELGLQALDNYTEWKTVYMDVG